MTFNHSDRCSAREDLMDPSDLEVLLVMLLVMPIVYVSIVIH